MVGNTLVFRVVEVAGGPSSYLFFFSLSKVVARVPDITSLFQASGLKEG